MMRCLTLFCLLLCSAMAAQAQSPSELLLSAATRGDVPALEGALKAGAPADARDGQRRTALLVATYNNRVEVARALIRAGADVNAKDAIEDSPFLYAGAEGQTEILKLALAAGADLRSTNRYGGTALIPAAHHGHVENVRVLVGTPIDVNHVNRLGWTALLEAVILGDGGLVHQEIVQLLLSHGAKPDLADRDGVTPLAHAKRRGHRAMIDLLVKAGAH